MEASSDILKGRTFSIDLSSNGTVHLQEAIKQKLEEFMGSYTDNVLAMGICCYTCMSWKAKGSGKERPGCISWQSQWCICGMAIDHIESNINLYMSSSELSQPVEVNEQAKVSSEEQVKRRSEKQNKRNVDVETKSKGDNGASVSVLTHTEVNERPIKSHENGRKKGWNPSDHKPLREVKETPRQQSKYDERNDSREVQNSEFKGKSVLKRPHSPEPWACRFWDDEGHSNKVRDTSHGGVKCSFEGVGNVDLVLLVTTRSMTRNTLACSVACEHDQWGRAIAGVRFVRGFLYHDIVKERYYGFLVSSGGSHMPRRYLDVFSMCREMEIFDL